MPESPRIPITKVSLPSLESYQHLLQEIWDAGWVTNNGPKVQSLEKGISEYIGVNHCSYVTNGTVALQLTFRALGISGSVITTPFSYVATTAALLYEGLQPVFVDVEPDHFTIDPCLIEEAIREDTTAILATHVYGYPCHHRQLRQIADRHGLRLIYDAAHAFGVTIGEQSILGWGDASALSFHATKLFHTIEGGGIICREPQIREKVELLRSFGHVNDEYYQVGTNAKNTELHAAVGLLNLPRMEEKIARRKQISERYQSALEGTGLRYLYYETIPGLHYNYGYFPVVCESLEQREAIVAALEADNVFPRRYFEPSLNRLPYLDEADQVSCPVSERAAETVLCLPLYEALTESDIDRVLSGVMSTLSATAA